MKSLRAHQLHTKSYEHYQIGFMALNIWGYEFTVLVEDLLYIRCYIALCIIC